MTIGNIYIEFQKITTFGHPWGVIGVPWDCLEELFDALGASWGRIVAPRGLNGALRNSTTKLSQSSNVGRSNNDRLPE